jgi:hypothetical protein
MLDTISYLDSNRVIEDFRHSCETIRRASRIPL